MRTRDPDRRRIAIGITKVSQESLSPGSLMSVAKSTVR
jgi:hypothetical protein